MASKKTDTIIIAELTVPWEERMDQSNVLKEYRYFELTMDLIHKGIECTSLPSKLEHRDWWVGPVTSSLERLAYQVEM